MSDVKNIWVLKQPVSIEDYDGGDLVEVDGHILLQSEIKELFVPLDVESLTTQVETIIETVRWDSYYEGRGLKILPDGYDKSAVAEILTAIRLGEVQ